MEKVLLMTIVICVLFGIIKFLEMKYIEKHLKPLKEILRDLVMVFASSFVSIFIFFHYQNSIDDFVSVLTNTSHLKSETTQVFTGVPDF
uniref:Uncharacterized protein n=1 Tax=viral metagenome TaxID=1070528 RepID=A0A6C0CPI2_9ZZZZ